MTERRIRPAWGRALGGACLAALLAAGTAGAGPAAKDEIVLTLKEKVIRNLSSSGLVLAFHIGLANPSDSPGALVRYRYRVRINQVEYLNMTVALEEPLAVPPGGESLVALPIRISYDNLRAAVGPVEGQAGCDVVGDMYFDTGRRREQRVAFAFSGEFPIFREPEVDILPLKVNDLTVGGADVVFRPRFKNFNGYELIVDTIDFDLYFQGEHVLAGPIPGDKSLPASGEKIFSLPFLLDFFEAGEGVRACFEAEEFPCRFAGRIEIASVWGRLHIRFDRTQALRLERADRPQNQ
jgi:LEA14-like dessication related protein